MRRALAAILVVGLLVRAAHFAALASSALPGIQLAIPGADTAAHWQWSGEILAGDWLGRNTFHQVTGWMTELAPIETWYRWWGSEKTFTREPAYPYFLALVRLVAGSSLLGVLGIQLLLGALQPLVLFALGRRVAGERAGLLAALVGAIYGPFVFFEGTLLRDWMPPILDPLVILAILRARDGDRTRDWILAGVLFAICVLVRSSMLLFLPLALAWILWEGKGARSLPLLAGFAIGFAPLVARNLAVGAPAFAVTNRAPEAIVESNAVDAVPIGMPVPRSMPAILEQARGRALRAAVLTVEQYEGRPLDFLRVQFLKLWGAFDPREFPDNLDYEYGRAVSPVLRFAPGFAIVGLFGVAGLVFFLRRGGAHRLVTLYVLSALGAQLVTVVVGRYRLGTVAALIAVGAAYAVACCERTRGLRPLLLLPVLAIGYLVLRPAPLVDPAFDDTGRALEYGATVQLEVEDGRFEDALAEVARFRRNSGDKPRADVQAGYLEGFVRCAWGEDMVSHGRTADARAQAIAARTAFDQPLQDASAWLQLGNLFVAVGEREEGEKWLARYRRESPR